MKLPFHTAVWLIFSTLSIACLAGSAVAATEMALIESRRIWDAAPYNAFTDLIRFNDRFYCTFREGADHASPDGKLRVLSSGDGRDWQSTALLECAEGDLRDPKLTVTPAGQLMITAAIAYDYPAYQQYQSLAWFSADGTRWGDAAEIGEPNMWLWNSPAWRNQTGYGVGYNIAGDNTLKLYTTSDGLAWNPIVADLFPAGDYPNESSMVFDADGTAHMLLRRDGGTCTAQLGTAQAPYADWTWQDLGVHIYGPDMIQLPDGDLVGAVGIYDGPNEQTWLAAIDPASGTLNKTILLPSGSDSSYAGMVLYDGCLWVSYYSNHEGPTGIYLARVAITPEPTAAVMSVTGVLALLAVAGWRRRPVARG